MLTSVSKVDPIKVYFPISEQEYMRFSNAASSNGSQKSVNALELELELADGKVFPHRGKVAFVDRQIDPQTGTIRLVAAFPNPGNVLRPGQFGRVHAATSINRSAILIPQRCVSELQGTHQVAVVDNSGKVTIRNVKVGERIGTQWIIESGLKAGEQVITEGNSKVQDGMVVRATVGR